MPDCSAATAEASWSASGADRLVIEVPNRIRDSSSSCGSGGDAGEDDLGLEAGALDDDARVEPLDRGLGVDVEQRVGRAFALEADHAAVEPEDAAGEIVIALDEVGTAGEARRIGEAADLEVGRPAAVDAEAGDLQVAAGELEVELPRVESGGSITSSGSSPVSRTLSCGTAAAALARPSWKRPLLSLRSPEIVPPLASELDLERAGDPRGDVVAVEQQRLVGVEARLSSGLAAGKGHRPAAADRSAATGLAGESG